MTFGSLFAGIGGFDLGFERAGMTCKWQVEIDPFCRKVLAKHWPDVRRHDDVRTFPTEPIDEWRVDCICGGFPCQPISVAGKQLGTSDERWLWPQFMRVVRQIRPGIIVVENVAGLMSVDAGRIFGTVLRDLAAGGYDAEWDCLPACEFGANHERERAFLVAHSTGDGRQGHGVFSVQGEVRRTFEALDAWNGSCAAFSKWEKLLAEPRVERVDDGFASRLDRPKRRLRAIGNAVVPQVAEWIGRRLMESNGAKP